MQKTNIEWVRNPDGSQGYTHNSMTGCKNHTPEGLCLDGLFPCYAYKLANGRLKHRYLESMNCLTSVDFRNGQYKPNSEAYLDPFYPRFWEDRLVKADKILKNAKKPMGIFPVDMGDWCGIGIPESWSDWILELARRYPQHRHYLLTKQPQNLIKFSPFPENCWVGVTATKFEAVIEATKWLAGVEAGIKYLSLEPLLDWQTYNEKDLPWRLWKHAGVSWLIIGACTGTLEEMMDLKFSLPAYTPASQVKRCGKKWTLQPRIEWVKEIVEAADKAGVKVFLKDNLEPIFLNAIIECYSTLRLLLTLIPKL